MFSELIIVCATFIGVGFVGDISIILGVILFSSLTYFCTQNCLYESDNEESENIETQTTKFYLNRYACIVGNGVRRIVCSVRWSYLLIQIRKVLYILQSLHGSKSDEKTEILNNSSQNENPNKSNQTCNNQKSVEVELSTIVDCILREYIKWWYHNKISQDTKFIGEVHIIIHDTLTAFCNSLSNLEKKKICCRLLQLYLHFLLHFKEAVKKVGNEHSFLDVCLLKKQNIADNFKMHHWALKDKMTEWFYLQSIMTSLIDSYGSLDFFSCPVIHSVISEILTRTVLYPLVNTLSDPDRLNSWIHKLLQNILKDENEPFLQLNSTNCKIENSIQGSVSNISNNLKAPIILLKDSFSSLRENVNRSKSLGIVDESLSNLNNSSKISDISEIFESSSADVLESYKCIETNGHHISKHLLFPCANSKAISNENLSNKSLNLCGSKSSLNSLESTRMKRSRSADYIRQMPHMLGLLPLNRSNNSIKLSGRDNKTYIEFATENQSNGDWEIAEEAKEIPPLFSDIKIINTFQHEDLNHTSYTLYSIEYCGLFQDTTNSEIPTLVKQIVSIRRRFREFLALQSRLEDNPSLKRLLKGIKGPSKWQATPFSHLDKKNVTERKSFLEKYLQELCKYEEICRSSEFQEFLAYGGDATIAFVKKPDFSLRLDKMIVRGVKGAFDLLRIVVPVVPAEVFPIKEMNISEGEAESISDDSLSELDFQDFLVDFSVSNPGILHEASNLISSFDYDSSSSTDYCLLPTTSRKSLLYSFSINEHDSCACTDIVTSSELLKEENIIANALIDLIIESFHKFPENKTTSHIQLFKFLSSSVFERFIEEKLDEISEEKCARLLHSFHKALWPEDKSKPKGNKILDLPILLSKFISKKLNGVLKTKRIGQLFRHFSGSDEVSSAIDVIIGSLQNDSLNKCFLFYTLDTACEYICDSQNPLNYPLKITK